MADLEGSGTDLIEVLFRYLSGVAEESREISQDNRCPN